MKLIEHKSDKYPPRTYHNATTADLTIAFAEEFDSAGEILTKKAASDKYLAIPLKTDPLIAARKLYKECKERNVKVLNVAGNGIYTLDSHGWTQESLNQWVYNVIKIVHQHLPFEKIISGGQTGVDLAGGVAAEAIGIDCEMTFPKGFLQRTLTKKAHTQGMEDVLNDVNKYVSLIDKEFMLKSNRPGRSAEEDPSP